MVSARMKCVCSSEQMLGDIRQTWKLFTQGLLEMWLKVILKGEQEPSRRRIVVKGTEKLHSTTSKVTPVTLDYNLCL